MTKETNISAEKKRCSCCKKRKLLDEFYSDKHTNDGLAYRCKSCFGEYYLKHKDEYQRRCCEAYHRDPSKYKKRSSDKARTPAGLAHRAVGEAKARGCIVPQPCKDCGLMTARQQAHHENYEDRLNVIWLCGPCHWKRHHSQAVVENSLLVS